MAIQLDCRSTAGRFSAAHDLPQRDKQCKLQEASNNCLTFSFAFYLLATMPECSKTRRRMLRRALIRRHVSSKQYISGDRDGLVGVELIKIILLTYLLTYT